MNWGALAVGGVAASIVIVGGLFVAAPMMRRTPASLVVELIGTKSVPKAMAIAIGLGVGMGFLISWLYAAIRPRFGPGAARTAVRVGFFVWAVHHGFFLARIVAADATEKSSERMTFAGVLLVADVVAALLAGLLYWETPESRHRRESGRWPTSS